MSAQKRLSCSAPDELHNFEVITVGKRDPSPAVAGGNLAVQFNGNPISFHAQALDESGQSKRRVEGSVFSVDNESHGSGFIKKIADPRGLQGNYKKPEASRIHFAKLELPGCGASRVTRLH